MLSIQIDGAIFIHLNAESISYGFEFIDLELTLSLLVERRIDC
jgi:hypothetical protein